MAYSESTRSAGLMTSLRGEPKTEDEAGVELDIREADTELARGAELLGALLQTDEAELTREEDERGVELVIWEELEREDAELLGRTLDPLVGIKLDEGRPEETHVPAQSTWFTLEQARHWLGPAPEQLEQLESQARHDEEAVSKNCVLLHVGRQRPLVRTGRVKQVVKNCRLQKTKETQNTPSALQLVDRRNGGKIRDLARRAFRSTTCPQFVSATARRSERDAPPHSRLLLSAMSAEPAHTPLALSMYVFAAQSMQSFDVPPVDLHDMEHGVHAPPLQNEPVGQSAPDDVVLWGRALGAVVLVQYKCPSPPYTECILSGRLQCLLPVSPSSHLEHLPGHAAQPGPKNPAAQVSHEAPVKPGAQVQEHGGEHEVDWMSKRVRELGALVGSCDVWDGVPDDDAIVAWGGGVDSNPDAGGEDKRAGGERCRRAGTNGGAGKGAESGLARIEQPALFERPASCVRFRGSAKEAEEFLNPGDGRGRRMKTSVDGKPGFDIVRPTMERDISDMRVFDDMHTHWMCSKSPEDIGLQCRRWKMCWLRPLAHSKYKQGVQVNGQNKHSLPSANYGVHTRRRADRGGGAPEAAA
ncbi:hypothetical protein C8J57DRAFT_1566168 [Mycena rebaudengoi]|nr:hypothetical protein C8J57DRAFT_1566168 [Mycena rebaudengoi]